MLPGMDSCVRFVLRRALIVFEILRDTVGRRLRRAQVCSGVRISPPERVRFGRHPTACEPPLLSGSAAPPSDPCDATNDEAPSV
jgi:hypothetical protein